MRARRFCSIAAVTAVLGVSCGGSDPAPPPAPARPVVVSRPAVAQPLGDRLQARIATGTRDVVSIAAAGDGLWVSAFDQRSVIEIDPRSNRVVGRVGVPGHPAQMLAYDGLLWVLLPDEGLVAVVDPGRRRIVRFVRSEKTCMTPMAFGEGALWLMDDRVAWSASKRDPATGVTLQTLPAVRNWRCATAVAGGAVWSGTPGLFYRIDIGSNRITARIDAGPEPIATAVGLEDEVWIGNQERGEMRRIDARSGQVTGIFRFGGGSLAADGRRLWATSSLTAARPGGTEPILFELDRESDRVLGAFRVGRRARPAAAPLPTCPERTGDGACLHEHDFVVRAFALSGVAVAFGSVWVGQNVEGRIYRIRAAD